MGEKTNKNLKEITDKKTFIPLSFGPKFKKSFKISIEVLADKSNEAFIPKNKNGIINRIKENFLK